MPPAKDPRQYARVSVDLPVNRKLKGAPVQAKWLSVVAVLWSAQNLTDGEVDPAIMTAVAGVPTKYVKDLVDRDVWHVKGHACSSCPQPAAPEEVVIHDYLEHQDSAETVRRNRDDKARSGRLGNHAKWGHDGPYKTCRKCNP